MPMQIHIATEIPSRTPGHDGVLDDLLANQVSKFLLTNQPTSSLIVFPGWVEHYKMLLLKMAELDIPAFHGGGTVSLRTQQAPFPAHKVEMAFNSPSMMRSLGFERPHDEALARKMIDEARSLVADVLTSVHERREYNAAWEMRDLNRSA